MFTCPIILWWICSFHGHKQDVGTGRCTLPTVNADSDKSWLTYRNFECVENKMGSLTTGNRSIVIWRFKNWDCDIIFLLKKNLLKRKAQQQQESIILHLSAAAESNLLVHGSDTLHYATLWYYTVPWVQFFLSNKSYIIVWWLVYIIYTHGYNTYNIWYNLNGLNNSSNFLFKPLNELWDNAAVYCCCRI